MPTTIPPNATLAILRYSVTGDAEEQITTFGCQAEPTETAQSVADYIYSAAVFTGSIAHPSALNSPWTFVGVRVYKRLSGDPIFAEHTEPVTASSGGQTALPSNCAMLVHKDTDTAGRKGRGRQYYPAAYLEETSVDTNGTILGSTYTTIQNRLNVFFDQLTVAPFQVSLFHADGAPPTQVTGFRLDTRIATQRRRMRR